jgi:WXG100 family type VII secretion target
MGRPAPAAQRIEEWLAPAGPAYAVIRPIVEVLANPLDAVTGDPDALRAKAQAWRTAAERVVKLAEHEANARRAVLQAWEGEAAEAFGAELAELNQSIIQVAQHFRETADLLDTAAEAAEQAERVAVQVVKELIVWAIITIIVALASAHITAGASAVAGTAAVIAEKGFAAVRLTAVGVRLARLLRAAQAFLKRMSEFAKAYKLTQIHRVGVSKWATQRYATQQGYQLLATNWVIKKTIVEPTAGVPIRKGVGADGTINWPSLL